MIEEMGSILRSSGRVWTLAAHKKKRAETIKDFGLQELNGKPTAPHFIRDLRHADGPQMEDIGRARIGKNGRRGRLPITWERGGKARGNTIRFGVDPSKLRTSVDIGRPKKEKSRNHKGFRPTGVKR